MMLPNWRDLVHMTAHDLGRLDIAAVNLACAESLPGAPTPEQAGECLDRLDHYARCVTDYTEASWSDFQRRPEHYDRSEGTFRMVCLIRLLQRQFAVRYNMAKVPADVPFDTTDTFIHGALLGEGGTCSSLPVVYAAVARRLGYPVKLVAAASETAGHLFCRWDEPHGERFNIEANNRSIDSPADDEYRMGRYAATATVERVGCLLVSQTPRQELAGFLGQRGHRWLDHGQMRPAANAFAWACAMSPENGLMQNRLVTTLNTWGAQLREHEPPGYPPMYFTWPPRRFPESLPLDYERDVLCLEAWENFLRNPDFERKWWGPMRRGEPVSPKLKAGVVAYQEGACSIRLLFDAPQATGRRRE